MSAYETFASVYDLFMEQVEYDEWLDHIHAVWEKYGIAPKTILDLGCGTGSILLPLAQEGFDVIGVDLSSEMLTEADHKAMEAGISVRLACQDMTELDLGEQADCILSLCDCMNYLTEEGQLAAAFRRIAAHMKPESILLFDISDPELSMVTITGCEVSFDRSVCNVYYSTDKQRYDKVGEAFTRASGRIRSLMARRLSWRVAPELRFMLDRSVDTAERIAGALARESQRPPVIVKEEEEGE